MHSQSDITRLYLPRKNGGRGLINIPNHYKNAIINFSSYLLNSEEEFLKLTAILWWNWPWYSTTCCHEEIAAKNHHQIRTYQQTGGRTQKKEYAWAICKITWPTLCQQRAIQPMAKIFYPKKIYRVNNSSHPRTGNFHQIYWKTYFQCWRWWYMSNLPCRKRNHPPHHIRLRWSFTNKIPRTPW